VRINANSAGYGQNTGRLGRAALQVDHQDAGVDFMRNGKAIPVDGQTNQDLLAIGTVIARVSAFGLGISQSATLKES